MTKHAWSKKKSRWISPCFLFNLFGNMHTGPKLKGGEVFFVQESLWIIGNQFTDKLSKFPKSPSATTLLYLPCSPIRIKEVSNIDEK